MENTMTRLKPTVRTATPALVGMPTGAPTCFGAPSVRLERRGTWVPGTGLPFAGTGTSVRDRQDQAQGYVSLDAVVIPGSPAWSPPRC